MSNENEKGIVIDIGGKPQTANEAVAVPPQAQQVPQKAQNITIEQLPPELRAAMAKNFRRNGQFEEAAMMEGKPLEQRVMDKVSRLGGITPNLKNITIAVVVGVGVVVTYEKVAHKFDWPRLGLFGNNDPLENLPPVAGMAPQLVKKLP
jgi:hypothetical protein